MKVPVEVRFPSGDTAGLSRELITQWRVAAEQINQFSEGRLNAAYNAKTSAPTTETWLQGDFVRNSAPSELGTTPNKYVIYGWICTVSGTPGTWVQCRFLTGN